MNQDLATRYRNAKDQLIRNSFSQLNAQQLAAVMKTEGPLLLLAGAGSGKTTVVIQRIANLIRFGRASDSDTVPSYCTEEDVAFLEKYNLSANPEDRNHAESLCADHPVAPWRILAITFTNKAANEMKNRLETQIGPESSGVWAFTFHSACCRILRKDISKLGYSTSFDIYDSSDSERVIKDILKEKSLANSSMDPKDFLKNISRAKNKMQDPIDYKQQRNYNQDARIDITAEIYQAYEKKLKDANALDFDDLIYLTVRLFQSNPDVLDYWQNRFDYVVIDEYQDTNYMQYLFASLIADRHKNLCVVGDDDQSIYRFRGATIENILNFEKQYTGTTVIRLEQNYRSTKQILNAANKVISNNTGRKGKTLWTNNEAGSLIDLYEADSETDEAEFVASRIFKMCRNGGYKDFAVLYRTNAQSNALEYAMKRNGIPYRIIGGTRFFDRVEIKDILSFLSIIHNPSDNLRLKRIINKPPRGIGDKTMETAEWLATTSSLPLFDIIRNAGQYQSLEKAKERLSQFASMILSLTEASNQMPLDDFYDFVLEKTGYLNALLLKGDVESRSRADNIKELKTSVIHYIENTEEPTLTGFLEEIALYTDIEQYDENADAIVMMTVHSAKGLEFPNVVIVGLEDGLFPSTRDETKESIEEERRLCYVAITRAKKTLALSYANRRMIYGDFRYSDPSRFLTEIPLEFLNDLNEANRNHTYESNRYRNGSTTTGKYRTNANHSQITTRKSSNSPNRAPASSNQLPKSSVTPPKNNARISFQKGEMVEHKAFGRGMVVSILPVGNDALLEIAFDTIGTKKLMANSASAFMKIIEG